MSFKPDNHQKLLLRALQQLEIDGCPNSPLTRFAGAPKVILQACLGTAKTPELDSAMVPLIRRELVRPVTMKMWPLPGKTWQFRTPDGRLIILQWKRMAGQEYLRELLGAQTTGTAAVTEQELLNGQDGQHLGLALMAHVGRPHGTKLLNVTTVVSWHADGMGPFYSITPRGLECLDAL